MLTIVLVLLENMLEDEHQATMMLQCMMMELPPFKLKSLTLFRFLWKNKHNRVNVSKFNLLKIILVECNSFYRLPSTRQHPTNRSQHH